MGLYRVKLKIKVTKDAIIEADSYQELKGWIEGTFWEGDELELIAEMSNNTKYDVLELERFKLSSDEED